jgi:hypothetical protein
MTRYIFDSFATSKGGAVLFEDKFRKPLGKRGFLELCSGSGAMPKRMRDDLMKKCDGFLLLYSIDDRRSFERLGQWKRRVERVTASSSFSS